MDPALYELLEGDPEEEVEAIVRLDATHPLPSSLRLVARMGDIATCRLPRSEIVAVRAAEPVESLKAGRLLGAERVRQEEPVGPLFPSDERAPESVAVTGRGTVVGVVDWGCDFAHPDFRHDDGSTRLLALWDQRGPTTPRSPQPYGYGRLFTAEDINRALQTRDPYATLGYHPADGDPDGTGSHGTHVLSIAAGNGNAGGPKGLASEAALVFVNLAARQTPDLANLGDSVTVLEAVDLIAHLAGELPWCVNLSVGRHGGPHDGSTLVEQGFDNLLAAGDGRCIVQSCGNYFDARAHAAGQLRPGEVRELRWRVDPADITPNELEVWYQGRDRLVVELAAPEGDPRVRLDLGESAPLRVSGREVGRAYHRRSDPNNANHHFDAFLDPGAPAGNWRLRLIGADVVDGRFHAWVERDAGCPGCQSRFERDDSDPRSTTGTICNGFRTLAVGAYDGHSPERPVARFSSAGPTLDGRQKPDCLAPGVRVLAARSSPRAGNGSGSRYTRKSGSSMSAPFATGLVACLYQAAGRPLAIGEIRMLLSTTAQPATGIDPVRAGSGYIDVAAAVEAARTLSTRAPRVTPSKPRPRPARQRPTPLLSSSELYVPAEATRVAERTTSFLEQLAETPAALPAAAGVFDALAYGRTSLARPAYEELFEVVAGPGAALDVELRPGDLLVRRALGEGKLAHVSVLASGRTIEADDLEPAGLVRESLAGGLFVEVEETAGVARRLGDASGRLALDQLILRPRARGFGAPEAEDVLHSCRPGEGPPAAEPDPTGQGPHPLVKQGASTTHSRRPSVGFAQECLNNFLAQLQAGTHACTVQTAAAQTFITQNLARLRQAGQLPLIVDCRFGENTARATRIFQTCEGIEVDGKIGRITWPRLERFATAPSPPPLPTPPIVPPQPPPLPPTPPQPPEPTPPEPPLPFPPVLPLPPVLPPVPPVPIPPIPFPPVPPTPTPAPPTPTPTPPTPTPAPSAPTGPPAPATPGLAGLESRYFPPSGGTDVAPISRRSTVEPIIDGRDYFAQLNAQINSLRAGDAWYVTGWWLDPDFTFASGAKLGDLLVDRAAAGADVRVMVWANRQVIDFPRLAGALGAAPFQRVVRDNIRAAETLRARTSAGGATPLAGRVLIDWSGNAASSHHMKLNVFSHAGALTAFVGGIDYVPNRLDAPRHIPPSNSWHDAGVRVTGDAAERVLETVVTRWTEASTLSAATYDIGAGSKDYNPPPLVALAPPAAGTTPTPSPDTSIQVVRSFPDSKEFGFLRNTPWSTLPRTGIHEAKRTFQTMLNAAQRYVYIEDQGFTAVSSLFPSLVAACRRDVKVIAVLPGEGDPLDAPGRVPAVLSSEVNAGILAQLTPAQQLNLAVWQLDGITVHSKIILIDDELMSIGSANFMDRSMEFTFQGDDSECSVVAVSTANLVSDLRVRLWSEHLRVSGAGPEAELRDLSKSLGFWRPIWGTGVTFPHPDSRLVFVGPVGGGSPSPGSGPGGAQPPGSSGP